MRRLVLAAILSAVMASARPTPPARAEVVGPGYGLEITAFDVAGWAATATGLYAESGPAIVGGMVVLGLGGPAVHFVHGEPARGLISLGMRATLPLGVAVATTYSVGCEGFLCEAFQGAFAGALMLVAVQVVDWTVLGGVRAQAPFTTMTVGGRF